MVKLCLEAADLLKESSINAEVIDLRSIKPLDMTTLITSLEKTKFCVVVEEGYAFAGIASEIITQLQELCFDSLDAPIGRVTQMETPLPYSQVLESHSIPNVERICSKVKQTLSL
jgi:pyruvate dehydrogenase E1 component beta subunit